MPGYYGNKSVPSSLNLNLTNLFFFLKIQCNTIQYLKNVVKTFKHVKKFSTKRNSNSNSYGTHFVRQKKKKLSWIIYILWPSRCIVYVNSPVIFKCKQKQTRARQQKLDTIEIYWILNWQCEVLVGGFNSEPFVCYCFTRVMALPFVRLN